MLFAGCKSTLFVLRKRFFGGIPLVVAALSSVMAEKPTGKRLPGCEGDQGKANDVIFYGKLQQRPSGNIVFFGGDVQDYSENMKAHRDNHRHEAWNLEATAQILYNRFPNHHIWVVKPYHMQLKTFSVYSNFVISNEIGGPTHHEGQKSWTHLMKLLQSATLKMQEMSEEESCAAEAGDCSIFAISYPLRLIAFSKGCVVLNQFLYDLEEAKTESKEMELFLHRLETMYWLDGGHSSGVGTWVVKESILKSLVGTTIEVQSHVTPYQINDNFRTWIRKEQKLFVQRLRRLGVSIQNVVHFEEEEPSIQNHFKVITDF